MDRLVSGTSSFTDRKVSLKRAISILAKNNIEVNDREAGVKLDFLYLVARNFNKQKTPGKEDNLKEKSNLGPT